MDADTELQREELQELVRLLDKGILGTNNTSKLDADHFWSALLDNHESGVDALASDTLRAFKRPRAQLKKFKNVLRSLHVLTYALEKTTSRIENEINADAMNLGLAELPDEVLSLILKEAVSNFEEIRNVSHVCSRFRNIVLSTPEIWASCELTLQMTTQQISTIVEQSRAMLLKACIKPIPYSPQNIKGILAQSARLGELHISPINESVMIPHLESIQLPNLLRLSMEWSQFVQVRQHRNAPITHVYETWTMPRLRSVDANFIPLPTLGGANITQCKLAFGESTLSERDLMTFLGSSPLLEVLDLSFSGTSSWLDKGPPKPNANLPNLRSMSFRFSSKTSSKFIDNVLSKLNCENLSEMSVTMEGRRSKVDEDYAMAFDDPWVWKDPSTAVDGKAFKYRSNAVKRFVQRQTNLRSLSVSITTNNDTHDSDVSPYVLESLDEFITTLPNTLETLTLQRNISLFHDTIVVLVTVPTPPQPRSTTTTTFRTPQSTPSHIRLTSNNKWITHILRIVNTRLLSKGTIRPKYVYIEMSHPTSSSSDLERDIRALFPRSAISRRR